MSQCQPMRQYIVMCVVACESQHGAFPSLRRSPHQTQFQQQGVFAVVAKFACDVSTSLAVPAHGGWHGCQALAAKVRVRMPHATKSPATTDAGAALFLADVQPGD